MNKLQWMLGAALSLSIAGCASMELSYDEPAARPRSTSSPTTEISVEEAGVEDAATDERPSASSEEDRGKRERLAAKLLSGAIGWHNERKVFVVVSTFTQEGTGSGVIATVASEADAYEDQVTLCDPEAGCDADSAQLLASTTQWLGEAKLDGALALETSSFKPIAGFPTAQVGALGGKLVWKRDHFVIVRGYKPTPLPKLEFAPEFKPTLAEASATPDGSLAIALFRMDPGANYAKGFNEHVDIKVFRVP